MKFQRLFLVLLIMGVTYGVTQISARSEKVPPVKSFSNFPMELANWKGHRGALEDEVYNILGVEDYVLANYFDGPRRQVNFYLGFYQSQKEGDLIHSPRNCLPGAGWKIIKSMRRSLELDNGGGKHEVAALVMEKGPARQVVLYWFHSRGRVIASEYMQKVWLVADALARNRTDGSFVRLISPVVTSEEEAFSLLGDFAQKIFPLLGEFIPS